MMDGPDRAEPRFPPAKEAAALEEIEAALAAAVAVGAAGAEPTASSVVADLMDIARLSSASEAQRVPYLAFQPNSVVDLPILPMSEVNTAYYLRLRASDKPGVLAGVTKILADRNISIDAMLQKEPADNETEADIIILTHETIEKNMDAGIQQIEALQAIVGKVTKIRMETL
jgi:homoserine dehydrogenase